MTKNRGLVELLQSAGSPISRTPRRLREPPVTLERERLVELEALLHLRDGFRALGGALIVRPSVSVASVRGVDDWNQLSLWRTPYKRASELLFFAETIKGNQFGLYKDEIVAFDPERGTWEHHAFTLERWAERIVEDADDVGQGLVQRWQEEHRVLGATERLQPSVPLMFADGTDVEFRAIEDLELMQRYARLFREIAALPEAERAMPDWWWEDVGE